MDEQRQAGGTDAHEGAVGFPAADFSDNAWRSNGTHRRAEGGHAYNGSGADQAWSSAGAALEPAAEPLALLTGAQRPAASQFHAPVPAQAQYGAEEPAQSNPPGGVPDQQPGRQYAPGLDDDTPVGGMATVEPPLWREAARHAPPQPSPPASPPPAQPASAAPPPPPGRSPGYGAQLAEYLPTRAADPPPLEAESAGLPQRVPAEPDVPEVPGAGPARRERWTAGELAWIADRLRRDEVPPEPVERLDVDAVLDAVRGVAGVLSASVRANPNGVHTLRLELADDADPGQVSRVVARLLEERMGLSAASQHVPTARPAQEPESGQPPAVPTPREAPVSREAAPPVVPPEAGPPPAAPFAAFPPPAPEPEPAPEPLQEEPEVVSRPLPVPQPGPRVVIDQVRVSTVGLDAAVEVRLTAGGRHARGTASGPAVDSYVVRMAAVATAGAIDELLQAAAADRHDSADPGGSRCFVEHTAVVPFGDTEVAVVVLLLVCGGWVEQLTGSALVDGDPRQAMVRATLGAVNRRLEALLG